MNFSIIVGLFVNFHFFNVFSIYLQPLFSVFMPGRKISAEEPAFYKPLTMFISTVLRFTAI